MRICWSPKIGATLFQLQLLPCRMYHCSTETSVLLFGASVLRNTWGDISIGSKRQLGIRVNPMVFGHLMSQSVNGHRDATPVVDLCWFSSSCLLSKQQGLPRVLTYTQPGTIQFSAKSGRISQHCQTLKNQAFSKQYEPIHVDPDWSYWATLQFPRVPGNGQQPIQVNDGIVPHLPTQFLRYARCHCGHLAVQHGYGRSSAFETVDH